MNRRAERDPPNRGIPGVGTLTTSTGTPSVTLASPGNGSLALARITAVWPGPERTALGGIAFVVEYETAEGSGRVTLPPEELASLGVMQAYLSGRSIPLPPPGGHGG